MTAKGGKGLGGEVERSSLEEQMFFEEKLKSLSFYLFLNIREKIIL